MLNGILILRHQVRIDRLTDGCNVLELTVSLEEEAISDLCCQFPIPADYDGEGSKGSKFVFYL